MPQLPQIFSGSQLTPLQSAWDDQMREIEQATSQEKLADVHYRATCRLGALALGMEGSSDIVGQLRDARDLTHQKTEKRLDAENDERA